MQTINNFNSVKSDLLVTPSTNLIENNGYTYFTYNDSDRIFLQNSNPNESQSDPQSDPQSVNLDDTKDPVELHTLKSVSWKLKQLRNMDAMRESALYTKELKLLHSKLTKKQIIEYANQYINKYNGLYAPLKSKAEYDYFAILYVKSKVSLNLIVNELLYAFNQLRVLSPCEESEMQSQEIDLVKKMLTYEQIMTCVSLQVWVIFMNHNQIPLIVENTDSNIHLAIEYLKSIQTNK